MTPAEEIRAAADRIAESNRIPPEAAGHLAGLLRKVANPYPPGPAIYYESLALARVINGTTEVTG